MARTRGGPCVGVKKRKKNQGVDEPPELCGAVESHKWYSGPTCKNCYERSKAQRRQQSEMAKIEDGAAESGGNILLECKKVSAAR